MSQDSISITVPFYNEEGNVRPLVEAIESSLKDYHLQWELILVDDGSTDNTIKVMHECEAQFGAYITVLELQRNYGQTAAMQAGIDEARGTILVTLDGDLQNDPSDTPAMIEKLKNENLDLLQGWRKNRKDKLRPQHNSLWFKYFDKIRNAKFIYHTNRTFYLNFNIRSSYFT